MSQVHVVNNMEPSKVSRYTVCMNVVNTFTHLMLGAVGISVIYVPNGIPDIFRPFSPFVSHIHLCVYGYSILLLQTILSFNPSTGWAENMMYPRKRTIHLLMQILGSILAIAGCCVGIANVRMSLGSTHGVMGFVSFLLTSVSLIGALAQLTCASRMGSKLLKTLQVCAVILTIIIAFVTLSLGFDFYRVLIGNSNTDLSITVTVLAMVGLLVMAIAHITKRGFNFLI